MSGVTSTLSVHIETGKAASELLALQASLRSTAFGISRLGLAISRHGEDIQKALSNLSKHGFGGLSGGLKRETVAVSQAMSELKTKVKAIGGTFGSDVGRDIGKGLADGVSAGVQPAVNTTRLLAKQIQETLDKAGKRGGKALADGLAAGAGQVAGGLTKQGEAARSLAHATNGATSATRNLSAANRDLHDTARGLSGALGGLWMTYGQLVPLMAGFAVAATLKGAFTASKDFAFQMAFVAAVSGDSATQIDKVSASLMNMAKSGMFKPVELAGGMRILAQAGMETSEALATLPTVMALATAGETDLATAAETATGIMHAFGLEVSDIGHIGDVIAKAAAISTTSVAAMSESMKQASTVAQQYDLSLTDVSASLVALAERNITGQAAGTAFRNMMNELSNPTDKAQRALDKLGISLYDKQGNTKNLTVVMNELRVAMAQFDKQSQNLLSSAIFGERGNKPAQAILAKTKEEWAGIIGEVEKSSGFLTQVMARLQDTVEGKFKNMSANAQTALIDIGKGSEEPLKRLANTLSAVFTNPELVTGVTKLAEAVVSLTTFVIEHAKAIGTMLGLYVAFKAAALVILGVSSAYVGLAAVMLRAGALFAGLAGVGQVLAATFGLLRIGQVALAAAVLTGSVATLASMKATAAATLATNGGVVATAAATSATKALTLAMLANPIAAILVLVTSLAAAYLLLRDNTNGVAEANRNAQTDGEAAIDLVKRELKAVQDLNAEKERKLGLRPALAEEQAATIQTKREAEQANIRRMEADPETGVGQRILQGAKREGLTRTVKGVFYGEEIAKADGLLAARKRLGVLNQDLWNLEAQRLRTVDLEVLETTPPAAKAGTQKVTAADLKPESAASKARKSTAPLSTVDYSAEIKLYSAYQSEINKKEQEALTRSTAIRDAGLSSESTYLAEREAIRAKADNDAFVRFSAYEMAQERAADTARAEQQKQINEGKSKRLIKEAKDGTLSGDSATLDKVTAAANRVVEATAKANQAGAEYAANSAQRAGAAELDVLAGLKSKYGDPDDAIKSAEEYNRALDVQIDRIKGLTKVSQDSNIVAMEGSLAKINALIKEAEATQSLTGVSEANLNAAKAKRDALSGQLSEYKVSKVEEYVAGTESTDPQAAAINKAREAAEQMRLVIRETTERTENEKKDLIIAITERTSREIAALEAQRLQTQLTSGQNLFGGLASLAKVFGGEQSKSYRALFAVSKAFALAEAGVAIKVSIAKAAASAAWPANLGAIIAATAQGAATIAGLASQNFSGAYDAGGDISAGKWGIAGERGMEIVQGPARVTSRVETARLLNGGGNSAPAAPPVVNVRNINVLDPSVVGDYLGTDAGEQLIMNVVQRNQRALGR